MWQHWTRNVWNLVVPAVGEPLGQPAPIWPLPAAKSAAAAGHPASRHLSSDEKTVKGHAAVQMSVAEELALLVLQISPICHKFHVHTRHIWGASIKHDTSVRDIQIEFSLLNLSSAQSKQ